MAPPAAIAVVAKPGDRDGDGWLDEDDICPEVAEDKDGCDDEDGCPDPDNDDDGVPDAVDRCPLERGRYTGEDGCPVPPPPRTFIMEDPHRCYILLEPIPFGKNNTTIGSHGRMLLGIIAMYFQRCNEIVVLEIRGRKSATEKSPDLPMRRAEAVRADLIARGVDARRLRAVADDAPADVQGLGSDDPGKPRGVEFKVARHLSCSRR